VKEMSYAQLLEEKISAAETYEAMLAWYERLG